MSHYSSRSRLLPRPKRHDRVAKRTMMRKRECPDPHAAPKRSGQMRFASRLPRHKRERYEVITGQVGPRKYRRSGRRA